MEIKLFLKITLAICIFSSRSAVSERDYEVKSTIQSEDGDIIDCVDIYKQPAFNHPALKNHKIRMTPTITMLTNPENETLKTSFKGRDQPHSSEVTAAATQIWQRSGSCPERTVPILRRKTNTTQRKQPSVFLHDGRDDKFRDNKQLKYLFPNRSLSILLAEGFAYYGGKGVIRVWNPSVEKDDEYSISLVSLKSGPPRHGEEVESGWAVNPSVYGDRKTRFFLYWTADGSVETGCFDLTCPGFVQTSNEIALGAAIYPISNPIGLPYEITITILKDLYTRHWWVIYGENTKIGYWPGEIFDRLFYHAQTVQWGGEVYSPRMMSRPHTATEMGNGWFPDYISGNAGTVTRMRVAVNSNRFTRPNRELTFPFADEYMCYRAVYRKDWIADPEFYYGGPGRSEWCP